MRVVFMGTPDFAVPILRALASAENLIAVYTRPDKPSGRGRKLVPSPVKSAAEELGIPVHQPVTLRDPAEGTRLRALEPDVVCVAAYGLILPPEILQIPAYGCINVHASLLPRHRGAAPVHRAILDGDELTGISIMLMEQGLDTGPYALQVPVRTGERDVDDLTRELALIGADALLGVLDQLESGDARWIAQNEAAATYAPKITRADVALHPQLSVDDALRRIRASTASAASRLRIDGHVLTISRASRREGLLEKGRVVVDSSELLLGLADGTIALDRVKPEGRSEMDGASFVRGARLSENARWGMHP